MMNISYKPHLPFLFDITHFCSLTFSVIAISFILASPLKAAQSSCFVLAETYYEQIYCEIKQQGAGQSLPSFHDFKKNDQMTQALLLKRKAKALRIAFKMPRKTQQQSRQIKLTSIPEKPRKKQVERLDECSLQTQGIRCHQSLFIQTGNRTNRVINKTALSHQNKMGLAPYTGNSKDQNAINSYLFTAYVRYLEKMLEIGLGGVTMSYTKFHTLFHDLLEKEVDFAARFETMYSFLKKDKSEIGVSENIEPIPSLSIKDCTQLTAKMFTCDNRYRNTIYLKQ